MTQAVGMDREQELRRINRLIGIAERCKGDAWTIRAQDRRVDVITRRASGEDAVICTIFADALPDEVELISGALENAAMLLDLRTRAIATVKDLRRQLGQPAETVRDKNYSAQASILLPLRSFQRFLEAKGAGGPVRDELAADTRLKSLLAIKSKKELNESAKAQAAWLSLFADYETWLRGSAR